MAVYFITLFASGIVSPPTLRSGAIPTPSMQIGNAVATNPIAGRAAQTQMFMPGILDNTPRDVLASAESLALQLGAAAGDNINCVLEGHTKLCIRRVDSTCFGGHVGHSGKVPCFSLTNIAVDSQHRRQGHARRTLHALHRVSSQFSRVLLVENVVSDHMHTLIGELKGEPLPGSRMGAKGCHYWVPPSNGAALLDLVA